MLKVLVVNDDLTPTQFVVSVLQEIFGHSKQVAEKTALLAHLNGRAVCGVCREYVDANSLVSSATALSRQHGYPLGFVVLPLPFWERVAGYLFKLVMKVTPGYDVFYYWAPEYASGRFLVLNDLCADAIPPTRRKALASSSAAHHLIVMASRKSMTPRFGIEDEILATPIASISDIATKLEIIKARAELFDVSDDLQRLHDQIVAFRAGESLAPEPWNWHAT